MEYIILIDTSYTSFYRFYATLRWLALSQNELYKQHVNNPLYNWIDNPIFIDKYEKMYLESIKKLLGKKIFNKSKIIFCMDSPREEIWRSDLTCKYKANRIDLSLKNNYKPIFDYTYLNIIPNIINNNKNIFKLRISKLEADDIIAIITKTFEEKNCTLPIYIISGDKDFLQLGRENVFFLNYKLKKYIIINKDEAKLLLHKKILLGDKSDCIDSIFPKGFKSKIKKELVESQEIFIEYIKNNKDIEQKYIQNKKLIDFDFIPKKYYSIVMEEYYNTIN